MKKDQRTYKKPSERPIYNLQKSQKAERKKTGAESLFEETMAEIFPNLEKEMDIQIQETQ